MSRLGCGLATLVLSSHITAALAAPVAEVEPNQPITSAQYLRTSGTEVDVAGALSAVPGGDVDFYVFDAKAGDVLTIDIDNGYKLPFGNPDSVNTVLAVFGPGPDYAILRMNDNSIVDDGSVSPYDARIDDFVAPRTGTYVVGVTSAPRYFVDGGTTLTSPLVDSGTYTLKISGLSPAARQIAIEVKPGNHEVAPMNPDSKGKIPVAVLGSQQFNALDVDKTSLTFGKTGNEDSLHKCEWQGRDVNGDGIVDLVCNFYTERAGLDYGTLEGTLKGRTKAGEAFVGRAWLKVLPLTQSVNSLSRRSSK